MKKYFALSLFVVIAFIMLLPVKSVVMNADAAFLGINNVESLANCENPDGEDCDGHCVENNMNMKFCAKPGLRSKNCKMGYY